MSEVLPQNHLTLACIYASAKDQPYWIRQRYAEMRWIGEEDGKIH